MEYPCMLRCRFPSMSKASRVGFICPQKYLTPFKFPILGRNNRGLFSATPSKLVIKRDHAKMAVSAGSLPPHAGGEMEEEKGKEMPISDEVEGISSSLAERDRSAQSLGKKLEVLRDLVAENIDNSDKRLEAITYSAIYLKWINTCKIPRPENGGSDQPNTYKDISRHIFSLLEIIYSAEDISVQEILVIRKIYRCLSSFTEFTTSVPIIRIEDVAHQELKDDFNAGSMEEQQQLESIRDSLGWISAALPQFLESKQQLDNIMDMLDIAKDESKRLMSVLRALDDLRLEIVKSLETKHQTYAANAAILMPQMRRLCEIGLEDYSSVLLSRFIDLLESVGGAHWLSENVKQKNDSSWSEPLGALVIGIHQLGMSGWNPEECRAIRNELIAWQKSGLLKNEGGEDDTRIWGLRLKATLERAERLTEEYSETLLNTYSEKVQKLGKAFEIIENSYAEAEIRAGVIFQVSNLCTLLLKAVRKVIKAQSFDILIPGTAVGKLIQVKNIASIPTETEPHIIVVDKVEGDEEIEAAEARISGVILLQGLPRLSRLVFWARKKSIVVMTCEDDDEVSKFRNLNGEFVRLAASPDDVSLTLRPHPLPSLPSFCLPSDSNESEPPVRAKEICTRTSESIGAMRVEDAEENARRVHVNAENICGERAADCCRLASLAAESIIAKNEDGVSASFKVPKGAVLPFGSLKAAVDRDKEKKNRYDSILESIGTALGRDGNGSLLHDLHELVSSLSPSEKAIKVLSEIFRDGNQVVALRPSASFVDFRGAEVVGDDEADVNAGISDPNILRDAVSRVWASLFTPGALRSLGAAGVNVKDADVAVLVQETLPSDLSFVLHIFIPMIEIKVSMMPMDGESIEIEGEFKAEIDENKGTTKEDEKGGSIAMEIAPGLGEARARVTGTNHPWRLSFGKPNGTVETLAFANFSKALVVRGGGGGGGGEVAEVTVDYSEQRLTTDPGFRQELGRRLGAVGRFLEKRFRGGRWEVVGCVVGGDIYVEQMRERPYRCM